jgi:hypothetical protein
MAERHRCEIDGSITLKIARSAVQAPCDRLFILRCSLYPAMFAFGAMLEQTMSD